MKEFKTDFIDTNFDLEEWAKRGLTREEMHEGVRIFHDMFKYDENDRVWNDFIPVSEIDTVFVGMLVMKKLMNHDK